MKDRPFYKQAALVLKCIPAIAQEKVFALKGGTAINMFVRPMPRLSVDLDLTYVPLDDHDTSLRRMDEALQTMAKKIEKTVSGTRIQKTTKSGRISKLVVTSSEASIKIEPNEVLRGTTDDPLVMDLVKQAEELFEMSVSVPVVPLADLYGGKICATLDRQHPRDLFDIKILLENEGLTDAIRKGFVVFLASHNRPMHEILRPTLKDISEIYEKEFKEMLPKAPPLETLYEVRKNLIAAIAAGLTSDEKRFLLSLKQGNPEWSLLGVKNAERLPGIQWKLMNIRKMSSEKRGMQIARLQDYLGKN